MNITLAVDEKMVDRARAVARQQGTSLNALIRQYIEQLAGRPSGEEIARELERQWAHSSGRSEPGYKFRRDDAYEGRSAREGGRRGGKSVR